MRIGPIRFVEIVATISASSILPAAASGCMMPALLMRTLRSGCSAINFAATWLMLVGSVMSSSTASMPGLAAIAASRWLRRRPAMMTLLPSLCRASASPRPIPDPPPVMKMVLPESFMDRVLGYGERSSDQAGKRSPNIGSPLTDSACVASSWRTSQCSASLPSSKRMTSAAIQAAGRPLPEKRPWVMT